MSNKMLKVKPLQVDGPDYVMVCGAFEGSDTGNQIDSTIGQGFSVAGAGSGVYTITIDGDYDADNLISFVGSFSANAPGDVDTYNVALDQNATTGQSIVLTTTEATSPTNLAADEYLHFVAVIRVSALAINRPRL